MRRDEKENLNSFVKASGVNWFSEMKDLDSTSTTRLAGEPKAEDDTAKLKEKQTGSITK
ncbi:MAG: hypothetical protein ACRC46_06350 [Thermoguttaceae bacterium]